jgi:FKBP-type peptidyl-prolyl cis-trans isomerase FkpA
MEKRLTNACFATTMRLFRYVAPTVLLAACITEPNKCESHPTDPATETFAPALGVNVSTMEKTELGDYRKDLVVGTGAPLTQLRQVEIHYSAYLKNGQLIEQVLNDPYPLNLSTGASVGLADGMLGMFVGGQRLIVVPSELALGACDNGGVPGNSTIVYKIELLAID